MLKLLSPVVALKILLKLKKLESLLEFVMM